MKTASECFEDNGANWSFAWSKDDRRPLTARQLTVLSLLRRNTHASIQEVADSLGVTPTSANGHLFALQHKGYITSTPKVARSFRILPDPHLQTPKGAADA